MKFKYKPHQNLMDLSGNYLIFPLLKVTLKNGTNRINLDCLVDSGAGDCLFSTDIASLLGIELSQSMRQDYSGIGDVAVTGYKHHLMLQVSGFEKWISIDAGFIDRNERPILGHSGFFESYEVIFRAYQNRFEVNSSKTKSFRPKLRN